jgi:predicted N-acetyltransferase YhbS
VVVLGEPKYYGRFGFEPASRKNMSWATADAGDAFQLLDFGAVFDNKPRKISYHSAFNGV